MMHGPQQMPSDTKEVQHDAVHRREPVQLGSRFEAAHLPLALPCRLMRHLGPIVGVLVRDVDHRRHHRTARGRVTAEFVRDQTARHASLAL